MLLRLMPMIIIEHCLQEIAKIRDVAQGIDAAYVARSRIGRLTLALARIVAKKAGMSIPDRPGPIVVSDEVSQTVRELASICNNLLETSRVLCQPSEPLDIRWREGWSTLLAQLDVLEITLREIDSVVE
ncbi:MAG TPA: hypothetical protein ENI62_02100 [Gammaproteobacteria bacterium]|nr:hypothetical protein [Gammaproteobacteria bacterium]